MRSEQEGGNLAFGHQPQYPLRKAQEIAYYQAQNPLEALSTNLFLTQFSSPLSNRFGYKVVLCP
jgi:hypothetical protein